MLAKFMLIITITTSQSTTVDYEFYDELYKCTAVADEIRAHVAQRENKNKEQVDCACIQIEDIPEEI